MFFRNEKRPAAPGPVTPSINLVDRKVILFGFLGICVKGSLAAQ
jgi:hypothetical protein